LAVITIALVVGQVRELDHQTALVRPAKRSDHGAVLATAALARRGTTFFEAAPLSLFEPQVSTAEIVAMDRDGKLPPLDEATRRDFLTVLRRLRVAVTSEPVIPPATVARVESLRHADARSDGPGCTQIRARPGNEVVLRLDAPGTFRLRGDGLMFMWLRDPDRHIDGDSVPTVLAPEGDAVVSVADADDDVVLTLPTGSPTRLCGLAAVPVDTPTRTP
jgi:hypothetical protein